MAASASAALGGNTPFLSPFASATDALKGKPDERYKQVETDLDKANADRDASQTRIESERAGVSLPPPQAPIPMPKAETTSPEKAWGSAAMMLAMFGSLMTRKPMNTALEAAAGVLNAYHKGDVEVANQKFKEWQVANENAMKMVQYQNQTYQHILGELDKRESLSRQDYDSQVREITARARAQAAAFGDNKMIAMLDLYGGKAALQFTEHQETLAERVRVNSEKLALTHEENQAFAQAKEALVSSPDYLAADKQSQAFMIGKLASSFRPGALSLTQAQKNTEETRLSAQFNGLPSTKSFSEVDHKWPVVSSIEQNFKRNGMLNAQESATLVDTFQRMYNNQAVRVGLVKLNTEHAPFLSQLALNMSKFKANGGGVLSPDQAVELMEIMKSYRGAIVDAHAKDAQNYRGRADRQGLDPDNVVSPEYASNVVDKHEAKQWQAPEWMKADPQHVISAGVGVPVKITSGFRDEGHNADVGGSPSSSHLQGQAWDFVPQGLSMEAAGQRLFNNMTQHHQPFDQIEITPTHVHIGFGPKNRGEVIHAGKDGSKPPVSDARQAPDGNWYVQRNGDWFRVN